jgi:hypothetical protein
VRPSTLCTPGLYIKKIRKTSFSIFLLRLELIHAEFRMRKRRLTIRLNEQLSGFLQHTSVNLPSGPDPILATWSSLQKRYTAEYKVAVNVNACEFWKGRGLNPRFPRKPLAVISDHKSRGLNLESTRITDPDRLERLLVAVILALLRIMEVGALVIFRNQW